MCLPWWRRNSELNCGSGIQCTFTACRLIDDKDVKDVFRCPGARVRVGLAHKTPKLPMAWVSGSTVVRTVKGTVVKFPNLDLLSRSKFGNLTTVPSLKNWNIAECDIKLQLTKHPNLLYQYMEGYTIQGQAVRVRADFMYRNSPQFGSVLGVNKGPLVLTLNSSTGPLIISFITWMEIFPLSDWLKPWLGKKI